MSNLTMTAKEAMKWSSIWATEFGDNHADLLTCYPSQRVAEVLLAQAATSKKENEVCEYEDICRWFLNAVDRKLLISDFPLTPLAQEQLDELRARFGPKAPAQAAPTTSLPVHSDKRFVRVDPHRFVSSVAHGQISCSNERGRALAMSPQDAQILVARLRRGHFPQAEVANTGTTGEAPVPVASDVAGSWDYSGMTRKEFDALSNRDAKRLYESNPSFKARADQLWGGAA